MGRINHGMSKDSAYRCWKGMKQRCHNPANPQYRYYGAKGVVVCDQWKESFVRFLSDVGPRPSLAYSLDRYPNASGNYEPGNVRWATDIEQSRNRPGYNVVIEWRGERKPISEWTQLRAMPKELLRNRLGLGWTIEEAMTAPASPLPRPSQRFTHPNVNIHACGRYCVYGGIAQYQETSDTFHMDINSTPNRASDAGPEARDTQEWRDLLDMAADSIKDAKRMNCDRLEVEYRGRAADIRYAIESLQMALAALPNAPRVPK